MLISKSQTPSVITSWADNTVRSGQEVLRESDNLVFRAMEKVHSIGWKVELTKRIPMGAGLGGGSSNAGTFLRWLNSEVQDGIPQVETIASQLGADVPYFLEPQPAWVTGIGDSRSLLEVDECIKKQLYFLLVFPREPLQTKEVFTSYRASGKTFSLSLPNPPKGKISLGKLLEYLKHAHNDLEEAAIHLLPRLRLILERLHQEKVLHAGMTGSGSTCYAVFNSAAEREKSTKVLQPFLRENFCRSLTAETYKTT